jgi:Divergent InlB B-repeat domain/PKD domain
VNGLRLGRPARAYAGLTAVAAVFVGGMLLAGTGEPVEDVRLLSGAAWLSSSSVGQVTLLDGSSAEIAAQVQVAPAGTSLDVAQQGSTAYAINQSAGTLRRVDGGTFALSPPKAPIPDVKGGLTVFPGQDVLYTVDAKQGVLASADPRGLERRGELMSLASDLSSAAVDGAGALWALDAATGDLTSVVNGQRNVRRQVAGPGQSRLAMVDGHPVVVDVAGRRGVKIDRATGRPGASLDLDLRATDTVEVSGSASRLYLVAGRGVLIACDLSVDSCDKTVPLAPGGTYGPAVQAGDQVFVPDYTTGQVWIIDIGRSQVVAKPTVLTPAIRFQLFARDGVVFYNDTNSERAGVIQLDGTVVSVAKYDPTDPGKGLIGQVQGSSQARQPGSASGTPSRTSARRDQPSQTSRSSQVAPGEQPSRPGSPGLPGLTEGPGDPVDPPDPGQPLETGTSEPPDTSESSSSTEPSTTPSTTPPAPEPQLAVTMSNTTPTENQPVTLQVTNTNGDQPVSAQWTFGDGEHGSGVTTSHQWRTAQTYLVSVVAQLPDGRNAMTSVNVTVSETPRVRLTVQIPGGGGSVSGGGINCPGTCSVDLLPDTQITLTAQPDAAHQLGQWSNGCGPASACDVTVRASMTVSHQFELRPAPKVRLTASPPANGAITGALNCPSACSAQFDQGARAQLTAVADQGFTFGAWGGACAGQGASCSLTMTGDLTVSASFQQVAAPVITSLECGTLGRTTFDCNVGVTPAGVRIRWTVNGVAVNNANDRTRMASGCDQSLNAAITVVVSNASGEARKNTSLRCAGGS